MKVERSDDLPTPALKCDPARRGLSATGIYVRARTESGKIGNVDIVELDRDSLLAWLRRYPPGVPVVPADDRIAWLESIILALLAHKRT